MRFLFRLDLSLHAGAVIFFWNFDFWNFNAACPATVNFPPMNEDHMASHFTSFQAISRMISM